jgi:transcriptional regulator with XRE-family HTH domain
VTRKADKTIRQELGERIEELLLRSGKRQRDLAEFLGIDPRNISRIVNGRSFPDVDSLRPIAKFLRVKVKDLFDSDATRLMPPRLPKTPRRHLQVVRRPKKSLSPAETS